MFLLNFKFQKNPSSFFFICIELHSSDTTLEMSKYLEIHSFSTYNLAFFFLKYYYPDVIASRLCMSGWLCLSVGQTKQDWCYAEEENSSEIWLFLCMHDNGLTVQKEFMLKVVKHGRPFLYLGAIQDCSKVKYPVAWKAYNLFLVSKNVQILLNTCLCWQCELHLVSEWECSSKAVVGLSEESYPCCVFARSWWCFSMLETHPHWMAF
jgi:hypothetical protein